MNDTTAGVTGEHRAESASPDRRAPLSRRGFVIGSTVAVGLGVAGLSADRGSALWAPTSAADEQPSVFRHGVASGDPTPNSVVLWTRVTPGHPAALSPGRASPARVTWQLAAAPDMTGPIRSGQMITGAERDHTVKIDVDGLAPDTAYYYRFTSNETMSAVGRTRTTPAPHADLDTLSLGLVAHSPWSPGRFGAYRDLATHPGLSAIVHIGDYLGLGSAPLLHALTEHEATPQPTSLAEFRSRYAQHRSDPDLQAAHARVPWICASPSRGAGTLDDTARLAEQAFFEWMPVRDPATDGSSGRAVPFGSGLDLFMTDTASAPRLSENLRQSRARWKVVASPFMMAPVNVTPLDPAAASVLAQLLSISPGNTTIGEGPSRGPEDNPTAILARIERDATDNLVFIAGDSGMSWASDVRATDRSIAVQFGIPPVSAPVIGDLGSAVADAVQSTVGALNEHVRHLDPNSRGFAVLTAGKTQVRMQIWSTPATEQSAAPTRLTAEYTAASGARRITKTPISSWRPSPPEPRRPTIQESENCDSPRTVEA